MKISHKVFCLAKLELLTKECPVGSHNIMKIYPRVTGYIPLMDIVYTYKSQKALRFIAIEEDVSTVPGVPYLSFLFIIIIMFPFALFFLFDW